MSAKWWAMSNELPDRLDGTQLAGYTYPMTTNAKALLVGGLMGIISTLAGVKLAQADCGYGSLEWAQADAAEGSARGYRCEVIELQNGQFEAQCDETAFAVESAACDRFASAYVVGGAGVAGLPLSADSDEVYDAAYELCMVVAVNTPGAVQ